LLKHRRSALVRNPDVEHRILWRLRIGRRGIDHGAAKRDSIAWEVGKAVAAAFEQKEAVQKP